MQELNANVRGLPVELVFAPEWWHKHYGTCFDEDFFFHPERRVAEERLMRKALRERFPELYSHFVDEDRPVAGPLHLACGFLMSEVVGCKVNYFEAAPPEIRPLAISNAEIERYEPVDLVNNKVMKKIRATLDALEGRFGYVEGDFNVGGVLNLSMDIRGQSVFMDMYDRPDILRTFFGNVTRTLASFFDEVRARTGTTSVSINRSIVNFDPRLTIHGNCSVQMISPELYEGNLLEFDIELSRQFQPYGIHHCGNNMHEVAPAYAKIPGICWFDVGWDSDIAKCREALPDAFLNLRFSPVVLGQCAPEEVHGHLKRLTRDAAPYGRVGICCINMDADVPDENVRALIEFVQNFESSADESREVEYVA